MVAYEGKKPEVVQKVTNAIASIYLAENEADLAVIDTKSTPLITGRVGRVNSLSEELFAQLILADDRAIRATYAGGRLVHDRDGS